MFRRSRWCWTDDDRVVPLHSFKHAATLQHLHPNNPQPLLLRVDKKAGHGAGKSTEMRYVHGASLSLRTSSDIWPLASVSMRTSTASSRRPSVSRPRTRESVFLVMFAKYFQDYIGTVFQAFDELFVTWTLQSNCCCSVSRIDRCVCDLRQVSSSCTDILSSVVGADLRPTIE